jgi:iron(III) transport system substrate-binding protein
LKRGAAKNFFLDRRVPFPLVHARFISILVLALTIAGGCRRDEGPTVVLYVSADEHVARQVIAAFEKQTGIRVAMVGDTEAKKTTGLVERLRAEKAKPRADVFWSSEIFMTIDLAAEDVFEPYQSPEAKEWPTEFRDAQYRWCGFAARARVIVYAPDRVASEQLPTTWMNLTQARFKDRIAMADPRFGTTGGHLGAMKAYWDRQAMPGYYAAWAEGLAANRVRLLPSGNAGVVEAVVRGEADLGLTDTDDVWAAQARGLNVQLAYPNHNIDEGETGIGTLLIPNSVAMVKGGPNAQHARRLIDFLLSEKVERMLAESVSHNVPLRPGLAADYSQYIIPNPLKVDYALAAAARIAAVNQLMNAMRDQEDEQAPPVDRQTEDGDAR